MFALNLKVKFIATILKIPRYEHYTKVAFYTIQIEGQENDEFNDFLLRMKRELKDKSELAQLLSHIGNIGSNWGYRNSDFKREDEAHRFLLPFKSQISTNSPYGLRLYCVVLSPQVIILVNGNLKTEKSVRSCKNCYPYFVLANRLAQSLDSAIKSNRIEIEGLDIYQDDDFDLVI
jgi:hypothetical protein